MLSYAAVNTAGPWDHWPPSPGLVIPWMKPATRLPFKSKSPKNWGNWNMLPDWLDLVWFHNFLILLTLEDFSLFYFLKQWGFLPFAGAGMGHPSKIWHKNNLDERNISGKTWRGKKRQFRKTVKWNCLGSPELFTLVFAKLNSLISSGVLNTWKGLFLSHTRTKSK